MSDSFWVVWTSTSIYRPTSSVSIIILSFLFLHSQWFLITLILKTVKLSMDKIHASIKSSSSKHFIVYNCTSETYKKVRFMQDNTIIIIVISKSCNIFKNVKNRKFLKIIFLNGFQILLLYIISYMWMKKLKWNFC